MYIYVSGFASAPTETVVRELFEPFGQVNAVVIPDNPGIGFAALEMLNQAEGNAAIQALFGSSFEGRSLIVAECDYEDDRNPFKRQP